MHLIKVLEVSKVSQTLFFAVHEKRHREGNYSVTYNLSTCKTDFDSLLPSLAHEEKVKHRKLALFSAFN